MGRPREFDIDQAIRIATDLFWRKGFDGTSIADLTGAMKITAPSFYFAFGSKEALFRRIVDSYQALQAKIIADALNQKDTKEVVARLLNGMTDLLTDSSHPAGCLIMNSSLPVDDGHPLRKLFADQRQQLKQLLRRRFGEGVKDKNNQLPHLDPAALAQLVVTTIWGIAIEAQSGVGKKELRKAVAFLVAGWPCA